MQPGAEGSRGRDLLIGLQSGIICIKMQKSSRCDLSHNSVFGVSCWGRSCVLEVGVGLCLVTQQGCALPRAVLTELLSCIYAWSSDPASQCKAVTFFSSTWLCLFGSWTVLCENLNQSRCQTHPFTTGTVLSSSLAQCPPCFRHSGLSRSRDALECSDGVTLS